MVERTALASPFARLGGWARRVFGADRFDTFEREPFDVKSFDGGFRVSHPDPTRVDFIDPRQGGKSRIVVTFEDDLMTMLLDDAERSRMPLAAIVRERLRDAYALRARR